MAADITIVAAGIVVAAQPGVASEAKTTPPQLNQPTALAQVKTTTTVAAESLSPAEPQPEVSTIASAPAPDFSPESWHRGHPPMKSLAEVEAIEAQFINQQLGQGATPLQVSRPVVSPPFVSPAVEIQVITTSTAIAAQGSPRIAPPPTLPRQALEPAVRSIPTRRTSVYDQLAVVEAEIAKASVGSDLSSPSKTEAITTAIARQETQQLQQQAQGIIHNIPVPEAIALENNTYAVAAVTPAPSSPSSKLAFEREPQARTQVLARPKAQRIRKQVQRAVSAEPATAISAVEVATDFSPRSISPERQILAQVMMDSAEAQFLESSGLDNAPAVEVAPRLNARGSGPVVVDDIGQVTSVSQLRDVQPTDWAYQATQSLIERYGCAAGYPDGSFRGNRALSRYEFAAGLNACLDRVTELLPITGVEGDFAAQADLAVAQQLAEQFQTELEQLRNSVTSLEQRQAELEAQQFSTTTKLYGQTIFGLRGSNNNDVDLFPVDGDPERSGAGEVTLGGSTELTLATSFRGNDILLTTLQAGNIAASASTQFTNMGRLAHENDTNNQLVLSDLSYRFAATPNLGVIVGSHGVNPTNTFRGINPLEGSGDGAISRLGQRNPILELGSGRGGAGFDWQVARNVSLQGVYSATSPNQAGNDSGLFNGGYVAGGQVSAGLGRSADLGIHYLHSYSPNGSLGTGIGDAQVISPFATEDNSFRTHAVGATAAWRPTRHLTVGGWGGWTSSTPTSLSGTVQTTNWMGFAQVNDLFQQGNALGLLLGQPPKITSSNLPVGFNFPEFSDGGGRGGRRDTALHLEAFYRAQLNDQISMTPGIVVVRNPNHNADNDTLVVGGMRTTFRF